LSSDSLKHTLTPQVGNLGDFYEERAHFGAWVIVSSPLTLSFDLTNQVSMDRVWPIITNTEALAVSQTWAGHPGMLVSQYAPPTKQKFAWAIKCNQSDPAQQGWSYNATSKTITQGSLCLDANSTASVRLSPCDGTAAQRFTVTNATVVGFTGQCLDVFNLQGPVVGLFHCNHGTNQQFAFSAGTIQAVSGLCIAGLPGSPTGHYVVQVWAKPLDKGDVGLFIVNGVFRNDLAQTVTVPLSSLNITSSVRVRDIWERKDVGVVAAGGSIVTAPIQGHDSVFLRLTPQ
jgi:hypothetical protein